MKAYQLDREQKLIQIEKPTPSYKSNEVLIRVRAASLNYRDVMVANGAYGSKTEINPIAPLSDGAGEIVEVGADVSHLEKGDRVVAAFMPGWIDGELTEEKQSTSLGGGNVSGMLSEFVVLPASGVLKMPKHLSFEEAASLPCAGLTAWYALFEGAKLQPGMTVLLLGTGGVSMFALQFAKLAGAKVIITSSSDEKLKRAREFGADETINYKTYPNWSEKVREITNGRGVDHAVEVGGPGTLNQTLKAVRYAGSVSLMGVLTGFSDKVDTATILSKNIRVQGTYVGSVAMFERMNAALESSGLKPVVDRVFSFSQALEAYDYLQSGNHFGKVVIKLS